MGQSKGSRQNFKEGPSQMHFSSRIELAHAKRSGILRNKIVFTRNLSRIH